MARMMGKTEHVTAGSCPYGWHCCAPYAGRNAHAISRRITRRRERRAWQHETREDER